MPSTTTKRKAVKTVSVTGTTLPILSVSTGAGKNVESDDVCCFSDEMKTSVPRLLGAYDDITIEALDEGGSTVLPTVGNVADWTITLTFHDGTATDTKTVTKNCYVKALSYGTAQVDGERKATITITLHPVGGDTLAD